MCNQEHHKIILMIRRRSGMDNSFQYHKSGFLLRIDASKLYDRISPNIANISLKRMGLHQNIDNVYTQMLSK